MYRSQQKRMPTAAGSRRLRSARIAVFALFVTAGFLIGVWSGTIPLVAGRAGVSAGTLGVVILISSVGIVVGAQVGGRVQALTGGVALCVAGLATASFGVLTVGVSGDAGVLCCAMTILSFGMGLNDVGMNLQAVVVERAYGRPIMAAFHAFYSLGGVAGAIAVLATAALGWSVTAQLGFAALLGVVVVFAVARWLVRRADVVRWAQDASPHTATSPASASPGPAAALAGSDASARATAGRIVRGPAGWPDFADAARLPVRPAPRIRVRMTRVAWLLGMCALVLMFTEGVATDWSALQLTQAFGAVAGVSAFGFGAFSIAMTGGRLLIDRVVTQVGPVAVVRGGALLGVAGLALVVLAPTIWVALTGWAVLGVGLCGCIPQVFTAAGNQPHSAVVLSRVLTFGYVGIFGGPAVIGWIADASSVTAAMLLPLALLLVAAALAGAVRRAPRAVRGDLRAGDGLVRTRAAASADLGESGS